MKHHCRQNGFALMIVVILLGLMGIGTAVWAAQTRDLVIQTRLHTAQAQLDNLIDSAVQWAGTNPKILGKTPPAQWIRLNPGQLQTPGTECYYRTIKTGTQCTDIEVTATVNFRSHTIKKTVRLSL